MTRCWAGLLVLLSGAAQALPHWLPEASAGKSQPKHLDAYGQLPAGSVTPMRRAADKALDAWTLHLPDGRRYRVEGARAVTHANGDISYSGSVAGYGANYPVLLTVGHEASFGSWQTPQGRFELETFGEQGWLLDTGHPQLVREAADQAAVGDTVAGLSGRPADEKAAATIDVLFVYSVGFAARYPGSAATTRINHLQAVANQGLANSGVDLALRVVGIEPVDYTDGNGNNIALGELRSAVSGTPVAGLGSLAQRRAALGADIVSLIRPHDIELRGSCGIAYLFTGNAANGVNVVSDGFSAWSLCSPETWLHEIGHNLGAEHQIGAASNNAGFAHAHIALGRFHTVMGSFASGDADRQLRLLRFSNPQQLCGGAPCGDAATADNARVLRNNMAAVAGFAAARSSLPVPAFAAQDPDIDADGVPESRDAFPLDARYSRLDEVQAPPSVPGTLQDDPRELADFVAGRGQDRDGDGVPDVDPAAFDLLLLSAGNDRVLRLDGDSGLFAAVEIAESFMPQAFGTQSRLVWSAVQQRLFALVGGGVRRYSRAPIAAGSGVIAARPGADRAGLPEAFPSGLVVAADGSLFVTVTTSRSLHRFDAPGVERISGVFGTRDVFGSAPRDLAQTTDGRLWVLLRDGSLVEIDPAQAVQLRTLPASSLYRGVAVDTTALAALPDGGLLITDAAGDRIWRLDPQRSAQAEVLVGAGSGGLRRPSALTLGPDRRLYVSSIGSNQVLRYDLASGAFVDVFSQVPDGELLEPRALQFVPKVADRYPLDARRQFRPVLGGWFNPARSGHGFELARAGEQLALTWYTYADDGRPVWYLAAAPFAGRVWQAELRRFQWDGRVAQGTPVGQVRLEFSSEHAARFEYQLAGRSGSEPVQPLVVGLSSETQAPTAAWFDPSESGWGLSFGRQGATAYALVFYYDAAGAPTWALGSAPYARSEMRMPLLRAQAPDLCPGCSGGAPPSFSPAGELRFRLAENLADALLDIDSRAPGLDWQRSARRFVPLTEFPTDQLGRPRD